jgi:hypothetical protein
MLGLLDCCLSAVSGADGPVLGRLAPVVCRRPPVTGRSLPVHLGVPQRRVQVPEQIADDTLIRAGPASVAPARRIEQAVGQLDMLAACLEPALGLQIPRAGFSRLRRVGDAGTGHLVTASLGRGAGFPCREGAAGRARYRLR